MTITLSSETEKLLREKLAAGHYATADDVVLAALSALDQQEHFGDFAPGELDALIAEGEASLAKEGGIPADVVFEKLRRKSEQRRRGKASA